MGVERRTSQTVAALLLILLIGLAAYGNSFQVPFVFDDIFALTDNPDIRSLADFYAQPTRYVAYLTFALNYHFGGLDVVGYHVVNLVIHLLSALLVYLLLRLTFRTPYFQNRLEGQTTQSSIFILQPSSFIPLFAALLFVAHPIQTQAVTYIVQRMTSLTALFYLLSLVLYVLARLSVDRKSILKTVLLLAAAVVVAVLAKKTKEIALTLPFAIVLFEIFFFHGSWKRRVLYLLPLLATLPVVPLLVLAGNASTGDLLSDLAEQSRQHSNLSRLDYLFTQFRVIVTYLRLLILPVNQNVDYAYPVYQSFFSAPVFASFLLLSVLLLLAIYLFIRTRSFDPDGQRCSPASDPLGRLVSFGIFWFFLTLAVESSFFPIDDVIFEHRLYLPSVGAALVFATVFLLVSNRLARGPGGRMALPLAALLILSLTVATFQRNQVWGDDVRLWEDVITKSPDKARPYNCLGVALKERGRYPEAIQVLKRATVLDPAHPHAYNNLARALIKSNRSYEAIPLLKKAIALHRRHADAHINLAAAYNQIRQFHQTIEFLEKHLGWLGEHAEAHYHLGVAYAFLGDRDAAMKKMMIVKRFGADDLVEDLQRLLDLEK